MPEEFLSTNNSIKDPIVIDPPGYDVALAWKGCQDYVESCGGLRIRSQAHGKNTTNFRGKKLWRVKSMHDCDECGQSCDCDMEDHHQSQPDDCDHVCDDEEDDDYDEEDDDLWQDR